MRRSGTIWPTIEEEIANVVETRGEVSTVGDIGELPLPAITDTQFRRLVASRTAADPHVDIVIMYRRRCGHCKPEIKRVYEYVRGRSDVSGWIVEVDRDADVAWMKSQLLDEQEATPSTGYWAHGKLQLSSPSRGEPVAKWVALAREGTLRGAGLE